MSQEVYRQLLEVMKKRGGFYSGMDIPEFYEMVEELFTPEEAEVNNAMPGGFFTAKDMAKQMGRDEAEIEEILEVMANKGTCLALNRDGTQFYQSSMFMVGILEYQFMTGKTTDRDKKIARLIAAYEKAYEEKADANEVWEKMTFPITRVITVDATVEPSNQVQTYDQVQTYIDKYDPISVSSCYCRHAAALRGEDTHGMPIDTCLQFGMGAKFAFERLGARKLTKKEAREVLDRAEEAGLIHTIANRQDMSGSLDFICSCDRWHCVVVSAALAQPKPGLFFNSGFEPRFDPELCVACGRCIERCPPEALTLGKDDVPEVDLDRCFGCAVCATGCPAKAITMVNKPGFPDPPKDENGLLEAIKTSCA